MSNVPFGKTFLPYLPFCLNIWIKDCAQPATQQAYWPARIIWPQVLQIFTSQTEKFSRYTLILYFSLIQYWRNCRKICQTVSDMPKIMEKFSQPADENGHVLLPGILAPVKVNVERLHCLILSNDTKHA